MKYMVIEHTDAALRRRGLWYVADMETPDHHCVIRKKTLRLALQYCARLNRGERFFDSDGRETLEYALARLEIERYSRYPGLPSRRAIDLGDDLQPVARSA